MQGCGIPTSVEGFGIFARMGLDLGFSPARSFSVDLRFLPGLGFWGEIWDSHLHEGNLEVSTR